MPLYDAHNHLQDQRLKPFWPGIWETLETEPVSKWVVNGSCESDWPEVLALARQHPQIIPSFGYHPWYVGECTADWKQSLATHLDSAPSAIGEIGLDRWIKDYDFPRQEEVFAWQLRLAAERNLPVTIHCLQAWGRLLEILQKEPLPACGFLLHSYGGSLELIDSLAELGAYFSISGYVAHERKSRQRDAFRHVPKERLLIETDSPDQLPPEAQVAFPLCESTGKPINHPANLAAIYEFTAQLRGESLDALTAQVESNFHRLFGGVEARAETTCAAAKKPNVPVTNVAVP